MKKLLATTAMVVLITGSMALAESGMGKKHFEEKLSQFSPASQELIKSSWEEGKEQRKANHTQMKALHDELNAIITAPKFDKAAFLAKHQQIDAIKDKAGAARSEKMADLFTKLSQEDRQKFAEMKRDMHGKWRDKHKAGAEAPASE